MTPRSRGAFRPRFAINFPHPPIRGRREDRVRAAPAVSCAIVRKRRTRAYRSSGEHPAFPAQWLYGLCRDLLGAEFVFVTVAAGLRFCRARLGRLASDNLTPATGARTTRFCRTLQRRSSARRRSLTSRARPATTCHARRCRVHRIPPRVRDDHDTPLCGVGRRGYSGDLG